MCGVSRFLLQGLVLVVFLSGCVTNKFKRDSYPTDSERAKVHLRMTYEGTWHYLPPVKGAALYLVRYDPETGRIAEDAPVVTFNDYAIRCLPLNLGAQPCGQKGATSNVAYLHPGHYAFLMLTIKYGDNESTTSFVPIETQRDIFLHKKFQGVSPEASVFKQNPVHFYVGKGEDIYLGDFKFDVSPMTFTWVGHSVDRNYIEMQNALQEKAGRSAGVLYRKPEGGVRSFSSAIE